jgi:hypothetical protein
MIDSDEGALSTLLRDAAGDAVRTVPTPAFATITGRARRRRLGRRIGASAFAVLAVLALGAGIRFAVPAPVPTPAPVLAPELDPVMKPMLTVVPVLIWQPVPGAGAKETDVQNTIFHALPGPRDGGIYDDVRELFPDAPAGWSGFAVDQSATLAQFQQAAADLKKLPGVQDAQLLTRPGMWFTVTAVARDPAVQNANMDTRGFPPTIKGWASPGVDTGDKKLYSVRLTYLGPPIDRPTFELLRARVAQSVGIEAAAASVKMETMS